MIDPIAIRIGPVQVHWYGIIIAVAVMAGAWLASVEARRRNENVEHVWASLLYLLIGAIAGARIYHVVHQWDFYSQNPALIPQIWRGGIGIPGAIAGGAIALVIYSRLKGLVTPRWLDIAAPGMLLGQAIGRLGNFVNQELYGPPTTLPWGIPIDAEHRVPEYLGLPADTLFHPMFAYEAILNLIGVAVLLLIGRRFAARLYDGDIALLYFVWYGSVRTALEPMRTGNWYIGPLPAAMWLGIAAALVAGGLLVFRHVKGRGTPGAWMRHSDAAPTPQPG